MLPKHPLITPNSFHAPPPSKPSPTAQAPVTVLFICGNPGLIGYYHAFLSLLSAHLAGSHEDGPSFQVYGRSLGGFELSRSTAGCYDLEDQICFVMRDLDRLMRESQSATTNAPNGRRKVVLVGHSVGTYIAMEVLRRHRETPASGTDFDIAGGVMLFPTVVDIAKSPAGRKLTVSGRAATYFSCIHVLTVYQRILSFIPQLALLASLLAALITSLLPYPILRFLVGAAMGSPPGEVADTTVAFLKSKRGVRQAMYVPSPGSLCSSAAHRSANKPPVTWARTKCKPSRPTNGRTTSGASEPGQMRLQRSLRRGWSSISGRMTTGLRSRRETRLWHSAGGRGAMVEGRGCLFVRMGCRMLFV
jgi:pimeloyl-ACP methyl ester carboxylesterase